MASNYAWPITDAARDVLLERARQESQEGWTPTHDDEHSDGALAKAAACYAISTAMDAEAPPPWWPFDEEWWKPQDRRRNLVRAGALILAELERLDRAALKTSGDRS